MTSPRILPDDEANRSLLKNVHPDAWTNPDPGDRYNLVVVGGGTAGLITAAIAASLGARTALIERGYLGGDCLNVGCVPSKGLIRGARAAAELAWLKAEGLIADTAAVYPDFGAVMERMRRIRAAISDHDSARRYSEEFGVDVYIGNGRFVATNRLNVGGEDGTTRNLRFRRAVIATGARAAAPPIPGLTEIEYLTNESLFELTELPDRLAVIGAGPIGCEMAQSFARLGSTVELFEAAQRVLPREDPAVSAVIHRALETAGVRVHTGVNVDAIKPAEGEAPAGSVPGSGSNRRLGQVLYRAVDDDVTDPVFATEPSLILLAIGRAPNLENLGLEAAGVAIHRRGIAVNAYLQTTNRRIYAAGDVAIPYQFTHMAEQSATIAVQNALFLRTKKLATDAIPWCTYTSPEVARVGHTEETARAEGRNVRVFTHAMSAVDRARLDGETQGFVSLVIGDKGRILGATIVATHAGEMIGEIVLAMQKGLGVDALSSVIHPYPTQAEAIKRAAAGYLKQKLTPRVKALMEWWFRQTR